jgi:hypothetical protein
MGKRPGVGRLLVYFYAGRTVIAYLFAALIVIV